MSGTGPKAEKEDRKDQFRTREQIKRWNQMTVLRFQRISW